MRTGSVTRMSFVCGLVAMLAIGGCSSVPDNPADICDIFDEKRSWYKAAKKSEKRWGAPISLQLAILKAESGFIDDAKPKRKRFLGLIPLGRPSSAYGYAQAVDGTWDTYKRATGRNGADRDDFSDAVDFVGWYVDKSAREIGIQRDDAYSQYLAYHEGQGGFKRGTYKRKSRLKRVASKVTSQTKVYDRQLSRCRDDLEGGFWFF